MSRTTSKETRRLAFLKRFDRHLKDKRKRASFALYVHWIIHYDGRKSVESIAVQACQEDHDVAIRRHSRERRSREFRQTYDKLLYFLGRSVWDDRAVRLEAARYAIESIARHEQINTWIVDDTAFLKQGKHSVGVQRQRTDSAGKSANCQIAVSLAIATLHHQVPLDFELYLPESWANDDVRRQRARVPSTVRFKTKIDLALEMIDRSAKRKIPGTIIVAGKDYGHSSCFRNTIRMLGFDFAVEVPSSLVVQLNTSGGNAEEAETAGQLVARLGRAFSSRFCFVPVRTVHEDGGDLGVIEPLWLGAEWKMGEDKPIGFMLTTLSPQGREAEVVYTCKRRLAIAQKFYDLKFWLGLDHFEGRSFPGWHHHVSIVLCCNALMVAECYEDLCPRP